MSIALKNKCFFFRSTSEKFFFNCITYSTLHRLCATRILLVFFTSTSMSSLPLTQYINHYPRKSCMYCTIGPMSGFIAEITRIISFYQGYENHGKYEDHSEYDSFVLSHNRFLPFLHKIICIFHIFDSISSFIESITQLSAVLMVHSS